MQAPTFVAGATLSVSATVSAPAVILKPKGVPEAGLPPSPAQDSAGEDPLMPSAFSDDHINGSAGLQNSHLLLLPSLREWLLAESQSV